MYKLARLRAAGHIELAKLERKTNQIRNSKLTVKDLAALRGKFDRIEYHLLPHCLIACLLYYPAKFLAMVLDGLEYGRD